MLLDWKQSRRLASILFGSRLFETKDHQIHNWWQWDFQNWNHFWGHPVDHSHTNYLLPHQLLQVSTGSLKVYQGEFWTGKQRIFQ